MIYIPNIVAALLALVFGVFAGASAMGLVWFVLLGLAGSLVALFPKPGSERVYWIILGLTVLFIILAIMNVDISGPIFIAPLVFALGYFAARVTRRFTGRASE